MATSLKGRKVKCRNCGITVNSLTAYKLIIEGKNTYFCNGEHHKLWLTEKEKVSAEFELWCECYEFIKRSIMNYEDPMELPSYLIVRLQDLRNGFTLDLSTRKKFQRSKIGYPYPVITSTFKTQSEIISLWFRTKKFDNENQKINYMMAIVENKINDEFIKYKTQKVQDLQVVDSGLIIDEVNTEAVTQRAEQTKPVVAVKKKLSLLDFLTEDEL